MASPCKNETQVIVLDEAHSAEVELGSDITVLCHLPSEINDADIDIRWFKGTDCLCLYMEEQTIAGVGYKGRARLIMEMERGKISLELKDFGKSDDGDYLCQVASGGRTEKKTVRLSLKTNECTEMRQSEKTTPEQTDKMKMEKSVLMAVIAELKDTKQECKKKDVEIEELKAERLQTAEEPEKENTQQENMHKPAKEMETSELNDDPETKTTSLEKLQNIEEVKMFTLFTRNADALQKPHKEFIGTLQNKISNLREVQTLKESNVALIFCPNVSRVGTDIDAALKRFEDNKGSKLVVLVVLHHTFDPEKVIPDSSKYVNRTDILTVDCLFHEDKGLLKCQRNSDAADKVVTRLRKQNNGEYKQVQAKREKRKDDKPKTKGVKMFYILAGNVNNCDQKFIDILESQMKSLRKARTVEESDVILVFCPIVSRAGTNIESALNKLKCHTGSEQTVQLKPAVLVVLHHTFDPEKVVPDSSRCVKRTDILTVDCLFSEDTGLLKCQKNSDAVHKVVNWLIQQETKQETSGDNMQQMTPTSSCAVNYFVSVTGDAQEHHELFINALQKEMNLRKVHTVQESDAILLFCPEITEFGTKIDKPIVLISLSYTVDPERVLKICGFENRRIIFPVDCIFLKGKGLLDCQINREEISAVSSCLKKSDH